MEHKFDVQLVLSAFQKIRDNGEQTEDGFKLEGVEAISSIDGYSLVLKDERTTLYLNFHNTYHFDTDTQEHADALMRQIEEIDQHF